MNVLIIGGGISGTAAGIALSRVGVPARIVEARSPAQAAGGAFLAVAPNGVAALHTLGLHDLMDQAGGIAVPEIWFHNAAGDQIGHLQARGTDGASPTCLVRRGALQHELLGAARAVGVEITFGARLVDLCQGGQDVTAVFDDGRTVTADLVLGCDGVHSTTRRLALPTAPSPRYTGVLDCGAWTATGSLPDTTGQRMVWGRRAFFGYVTDRGTTYWFSNLAQAQEPRRGELDALDGPGWLSRLRQLHGADPAPVPQILAAADSVLGVWSIYDLPNLATWHTGRVCLLGDAAHAASPSAGQGASLALEDAAVLAMCLRDLPSPQEAFARFEQLRKPRAERVVAMGRRIGDRKIPSPAAAWLRDRLLPLFLRLGARQAREQYAYRIDWHDTLGPPPETPHRSG
ncbi:FAD-dependent monooxygenase [Kocuria sp. CPCC 205258]|jgi:FAD-dependent urate hydroxylase|uniref:FAD-dependent oxidoreductase n=1 Tax=Kocuria sp. CPCC 205258 TaxID=3073552 RepID=UPI0034D3D18C